MSSQSGSSGESTASRIDRIGRQHRRSDGNDDEGDGTEASVGNDDDNVVYEVNDNIVEQVDDEEAAVSSSLPPDNEAAAADDGQDYVRNAWMAAHTREPSNFSPWHGRGGVNARNVVDVVDDIASGLDRSGLAENGAESANQRAHSLPPPFNKVGVVTNPPGPPPSPPRRNTVQFAAMEHEPQKNGPGFYNYNWQATKMTVKERISFLFNSTILSDVTFVVGRDNNQQRIPAHKFVLSVGSAVFDAMFNSTLATTDEEIPLPDVEPASFLALLKFLYSDEVQIGPETVMTTLYTAKKYAVPSLEKQCVDFLKQHLCADNAFMLLTQARLFDEPQLAALCLETIDKNTPEALSAEGFTDIDVNTLCAVLDRDSLRIKESRLFGAVLKWSEAECARQGLPAAPDNKRAVLGRVLGQIRFPLMTVEEFAQGPAQSAILTDRECVSLFLHFTVNPKPPVAFLDVPRCSMTGKEQTVCRFQQIESRWGYSGTSDKIRFVVDRKIFVVGFGLYGSIHGPCEYQVSIQVIHTPSGRLLGSNEISFSSDGTNATFRVMFKEPIEIQPNTNYTASATLKGLDSHYGTKGLRKVSVECPGGSKVAFQFSYAAGNNNGTSVEDGQIPELIFYT